MATLEKIRSQQKLLFTIVIIALFLFIISIASADSIRRMFGPGTTIAQVGNQKIDYQDHRNLIEKANQQQQQQKMDRDELSQLALRQLIQEALLKEQYEKLGIKVTDKEITKAMTSQPGHPAVMRFIQVASQALGLPTANGATLLDAINNPGRYNLTPDQLNYVAQYGFGVPTMADAWAQQEQALEQYLQQQAFDSLLAGLFTANELDAKAMYNDNNTNYVLSYVTAPYSTVSEEGIEVSDADLKAKYDELKPMFKLPEATRQVDYIVVPIGPSKADYDAAEVEVDRFTEALKTQPGLDAAVSSSRFIQDHTTVPVSEIKKDRTLAMIPDSLIKTEGVYKYSRSNNTFRVAKVTDVSAKVDSVNVSLFFAADVEQADSVNALLAGGKKFSELTAEFPQQVRDSIWGSLVGDDSALAKALETTAVGQLTVFTDSVQGTTTVYRINNRKAPKQFADITVFNYEVDPSSETISDIKTQLSSFIASNSKGEAFSANADSLYTLRHATVSASTPKLGNTPDTRHAIQWAMNAKKDVVSPILEDNPDQYVVLVVKEIYDGDYIPYTSPDVKEYLTTLVKADKKGDKLLEKYAGKANDLAGYAQLMGAEVRTDSVVVFTKPNLAAIYGNEFALQGQVAAAPQGKVVGPLKGANEVMVFVVDGSEVKGRPYDFTLDGDAFMSTFGIKDLYNMLVGDRKVKNNTLKFENYEK